MLHERGEWFVVDVVGIETELLEVIVADWLAVARVKFQGFGEHRKRLGFRLAVGCDAGFDIAGRDPAVILVDELDTFGPVVPCRG